MFQCQRLGKVLPFILAALLLVSLVPVLPAMATTTLISMNKPTVAYSSESGHPAALAVDTDTSNNSYWSSDMGSSQTTWWQMDLQGTYTINQLQIRNWVDGSRYYHYYIRGSMDGIHWQPIVAKANNSVATTLGDTYDVAVQARWIRVNFVYNSANTSAHISDFKVYGTPVTVPAASIQVTSLQTNLGAYHPSALAKLTYSLKNISTSSKTITRIKALIYGLSDPTYLKETSLASNIVLDANQTYSQSLATLWSIPSYAKGAFQVYLQYTLSDGTIWEDDPTFFRVVSTSELTTYDINNTSYKGLDIFTLDGGMSAEFAVQKAAESLAAADSHSWYEQGNGGPNPVFSSPQFLKNSVQKTVDFYNDTFGTTTDYSTVIIATGTASVPYLARAMKAPVLPLQFLVSVDTAKEVQGILDYSNSHGFSAYSTLGYDGSMPTGVAWIKLLKLPQAYKDFLNAHHTQNVIIMGSNGTTGGETTAKKLMDTGVASKGQNAGDIFVIYTNGGVSSDFTHLTKVIKDINEVPLESNFRNISDWESGVIQAQIDNFSQAIKSGTDVTKIDFVTGQTYLNLYDFAIYASLEFMKRNYTFLTSTGDPIIKGIVLNPYLLSHPFYESKIHYLPVLFWQGDPMASTIDQRTSVTARNAISQYFPEINFNTLNFWEDFSNNMGGYAAVGMKNSLMAKGLTNVTLPDYSKDEIWYPGDGMTAPNEVVATNLLTYNTPAGLKAWEAKLLPITMTALESIPLKYPGISVTRQ